MLRHCDRIHLLSKGVLSASQTYDECSRDMTFQKSIECPAASAPNPDLGIANTPRSPLVITKCWVLLQTVLNGPHVAVEYVFALCIATGQVSSARSQTSHLSVMSSFIFTAIFIVLRDRDCADCTDGYPSRYVVLYESCKLPVQCSQTRENV